MLWRRAAATSSHTSRTQLTRIPEPAISKPPSGLSGSVGQQAQAAALQQQLLQQLQMRRAAQYGGGGAKGGAPVRPGAFPDLHTALEEYSRSGDISVLQGLSNIMGSSEQQACLNLPCYEANTRDLHSALSSWHRMHVIDLRLAGFCILLAVRRASQPRLPLAEPAVSERGCEALRRVCHGSWAGHRADCTRSAVPGQLLGRLPVCHGPSGSAAGRPVSVGETLSSHGNLP